MTSVSVRHALGSYPVYVEPGVLAQLGDLVERHLARRRVALVADESVYRLLREGRLADARWEGTALTFPEGERSKTRETWSRLTDELLRLGFGRDSALVALGGGVAGDLAGFVAATYMRGIPFIQVPTTLLAMLDASVGGKTGVDTPQGKNLIGAFHPPVAVVADPLVLATLPDREYRARARGGGEARADRGPRVFRLDRDRVRTRSSGGIPRHSSTWCGGASRSRRTSLAKTSARRAAARS